MKKYAYIFTLLCLLSAGACNQASEDPAEHLNRELLALPDGSPLGYSNQWFTNLVPWSSYTLVGMGEATHGTMDFVEFRQRLFRYLAEEHHCRTLVYEYSFRKSLLVNDYIHHRHDCLDTLFAGDLWIQDNGTLRQFIQWMRSFNAGRAEQDQLNFIGIDNQVDALQLHEVLQQIQGYLPGFELKMQLFPFNVPGKNSLRYDNMQISAYEELLAAFHKLKAQVESYALSLQDPLELSNLERVYKLIRALIRSHEFLFRYYADGKNIRDQQMAENVLKIAGEQKAAGPVALWAHNAHIANNPHYGKDGSPSMGWYLRASLKEDYLSVATSFSMGRFTAVMLDSAGNDTPPLTCEIKEPPPAGSLNALFHKALMPQFCLNIKVLDPKGPLYGYLDSIRPMIGVGDLYLGSPELHFTHDRLINLVQAHDLLFYFRETAPLLNSDGPPPGRGA